MVDTFWMPKFCPLKVDPNLYSGSRWRDWTPGWQTWLLILIGHQQSKGRPGKSPAPCTIWAFSGHYLAPSVPSGHHCAAQLPFPLTPDTSWVLFLIGQSKFPGIAWTGYQWRILFPSPPESTLSAMFSLSFFTRDPQSPPSVVTVFPFFLPLKSDFISFIHKA